MTECKLIDSALNGQYCENFVSNTAAGGLCLFIGNVRDLNKGRAVKHLDFEAYRPMALKVMNLIAKEATEKWNLINVCIHHRLGKVEIGESAVVIAISSVHRNEAFEACKYCIDELKTRVPIYKKEVLEDGEVWVNAHP